MRVQIIPHARSDRTAHAVNRNAWPLKSYNTHVITLKCVQSSLERVQIVPRADSNHTARAFKYYHRFFQIIPGMCSITSARLYHIARVLISYHSRVQMIPRAGSNHTTRAFRSYHTRVQSQRSDHTGRPFKSYRERAQIIPRRIIVFWL